jgi:glutaredoxin 3
MKLGFTKVFNLQGGLNAWVKDNLPLTKAPAGRQGRLEVTQPAVTVYMSGWCPYCQRAKGCLTRRTWFSRNQRRRGRKFREEMIARSGRRTVPQIFIGEKHVGGCDDLFELDRSGELDRLIQGA